MNGVRKLACGLLCFAAFAAGGAHAATFPTVHSTDEQGHRHFRFSPDNFKENFLDTLYWSMVNGYQTGDIFEFEESDEPYVLTSGISFNSGWGKHDLSFVGVKANGSPADPEKVVFIPAEGTQNGLSFHNYTNTFANITFRNVVLSAQSDRPIAFRNCVFTADEGVEDGSIYLARPWRDHGMCEFIDCIYGSHISPLGFDHWSGTEREKTARFHETPCVQGRVSWVK